MNELPHEDQPDVVWVGPVGPIPIHYEDDPRFEEEPAALSHARKKAQALHSAEELLEGVVDDDWVFVTSPSIGSRPAGTTIRGRFRRSWNWRSTIPCGRFGPERRCALWTLIPTPSYLSHGAG
jgi:hypothetical protein